MRSLILFIGFACIIPNLSGQGNRRVSDQTCHVAGNNNGQCVPLSNCPTLGSLYNFYPPQIAYQYITVARQSCAARGFSRGQDRDPVVCCKFAVSRNNPFLPNNAPHSRRGPESSRRSESSRLRSAGGTRNSPQSGTCTGPDRKIGFCKPLANCESLLSTLQSNPRNQAFARFLRSSNRICGNAYSVVCCPSSNAGPVTRPNAEIKRTKLPTVADGCGLKDDKDKVVYTQLVGGVTASPGGWPWIALIGYSSSTSGSPFKCGGTLITDRHVLTAAHCIRNDLSFIRLGEHDLSTDTEGAHIDVPVSRVLRHPRFSRTDGHNDIALLYLSKNVQLSERIAPICLPISANLRRKSFVDSSAFVAGWGRTMEGGKSATQLQELEITVYSNRLCRDLYRKNNKLVSETQFDNAVVCAGDIEGGKDSCQGDSGGPLMAAEIYNQEQHYVLIGIVSYGIGCARKETPGVYASVVNFIDWIQAGITQ